MEINRMNECHYCLHRREVAGNAHIRCANPDPKVQGESHGIVNGWFMYPWLFDPVWKSNLCQNFAKREVVDAQAEHLR